MYSVKNLSIMYLLLEVYYKQSKTIKNNMYHP